MTEQERNANYLTFVNYLEKYGCYSKDMDNELGEKIKNAPYSTKTEFGGAFDGGLVYVTLNNLCKNAARINSTLNPVLQVNNNMLIRVLLLLNIAKCEMFKPADDWHIKHGMPYDFVENKTKMKVGVRSLYLCNKYGIKLEEEEFEAFLIADSPEPNGVCYQSPLYTVVRATIDLTLVELRQRYLASQKVETIER